MHQRMLAILGCVLLCLPATGFTAVDTGVAEPRTALVIGNGAYDEVPLRNAVTDAQDVAAKLRERGFEVIHRENLHRRELRKAIRLFGKKLRDKGIGLFYFAGHGLQQNGLNYLLSVGADVQQAFEISDEALEADSVLRAMESAGNDLNIVILDACRNNPFARNFRSRRVQIFERAVWYCF